MKIILNADDLGANLEVNASVFSLIERRKITSATLLANGLAFHQAVNEIPQYKDTSFGIHLNLTEYKALTHPDVFFELELVDERGYFLPNIRNIRPTKRLKQAIYLEFKEQIIKILDNGISVSHIDSHHHIHTIPWIFCTLKKIQKTFRIRKVRISRNQYDSDDKVSYKLFVSKKAWNYGLRNIYRTTTTDYFTDFLFFLKIVAAGRVPKQGCFELMCHPGQDYSFDEWEILSSNWKKKIPFKIDLISYMKL